MAKQRLLNFFAGCMTPTEGQILLNGIDIRKYRYEDYTALFSVVFQDFKPIGR